MNTTAVSVNQSATAFLPTTTLLTVMFATTTRGSAYSCYKYPRTNLPDWFISSVLEPYERIYCQTAAVYALNASNYVIIDRATGARDDYRRMCWGYYGLLYYRYIGTLARTLGLIAPPPSYGGFLYAINDYLFIALLLLFVCTPLAFAGQLLALHVIRRVLAQSDAYLYIYHGTLVFVNAFIYLMSASISLTFLGFLFLPCCLLSEAIAIQFESYQTAANNVMLSSLFTFGSWVQGVLALDRMLAVYVPVTHRAYASGKLAAKTIGAIFVCNAVLTLIEFCAWTAVYHAKFDNGWFCGVTGGCVSALLAAASRVNTVAGIIRLVVQISGTLLQIVCCGLLFLKVSSIRRGQSSQSNQVSLLPCYLLIGTCGADIFAGFMESLNTAGTVFTYLAVFNTYTVAVPFSYARYITLSGFSCIALYVHCIVSPLYRQEVSKILAPFLRVCKVCQKNKVASINGGGEAGAASADATSSDGTQMSTLRKRSLSSRGQSTVHLDNKAGTPNVVES